MYLKTITFKPGWEAAIFDPPSFDHVARCIKNSTYDLPVPLKLVVGFDRGDGEKYVAGLLVVPTSIRVDFEEGAQEPDYIFEGWVVRPPYASGPSKVWLRGILMIGEDDRIGEAHLSLLDPGSETDIAPSRARAGDHFSES